MDGLTMLPPQRLAPLLARAERFFPNREVLDRTAAGIHRSNWGEIGRRARRLASSLDGLGLAPFDRVGTLAWNTHRHVELYYAVPGSKRILHTLNLRLHADTLAWVINHADDRVIFVDDSLVPMLESIADKLTGVKGYVVMGDGPLATKLSPAYRYEDLVARGDPDYRFPDGEENDAALLCYTTGTTGNPKGVLYSHRALVHASVLMTTVDGFGLCEKDSILVAVPLFHAAGWCMPYTGAMTGAKLVLPGPNLTPPDILGSIDAEGITFSAGVPTLWSGIADAVEKEGRKSLRPLERVICAGSAVPAALIGRYEKLGVSMRQAWGMTEIPLGTMARVKQGTTTSSDEERWNILSRQGIPAPTVDIRICDPETGTEVLHDGKTTGELEIRGLNAAKGYFNDTHGEAKLHDGWFRTGDVATIDPEGYMQIRDRTKDVIKSGGEWISSVELEGHLVAHPAVREAAVIARPDPKWVERPLACVVLREGMAATASDLKKHLAPRVARWTNPEAYAFVSEIPKTSIGKIDKKTLRERLARGELAIEITQED